VINLLPPELKTAYRFGRINRHLVHWIVALTFGIIGAVLITAVGYFYLHQSAKSYAKQVETTNQQLVAQNLTGVQSQIKDISNNLKLAVDVLSKQILFSNLLDQLGKTMPTNTLLTGLSISQSQGAVDISALAKDYAAAAQIQVNLQDPANQIFSKADTININCATTSDYPCSVQIRALFDANNPYMFTGDAKK
jgi:Tfp pilus assembly protein PilN